MMFRKFIYLLFVALIFVQCTDDDLIVNPTTNLGSETAITSDADLELAKNAVYNYMTTSTYYGGKFLTAGDMLGDDAINPPFASGWLSGYFDYSWTKIATETAMYKKAYEAIAQVNYVLEKANGLEQSAQRDALIAELKVLRAFIHFDLSKLYGPLPVNLGKGGLKADALAIPIMKEVLSPSDIEGMLRKPVTEVYAFVISEIEANLSLLPEGKINGMIGIDAAKAMLARIYLYKGDMVNALKYSKDVIDSGNYSLISRNSYVASWGEAYTSEAIFELDYIATDNNGINGIGYYVLADGASGYKEITASASFESLMATDANDVRFSLFVANSENGYTGYLPTKKYPGREGDPYINNIKVFRLSEMYLIAAEASLGTNAGQAATYLNDLRKNRTTTEPEKYDASLTVDDVLYERRLELFAEGHRAWDLWRNQKSVVRWNSVTEKTDLNYLEDESDGIIEYNDYKNILAINEDQLNLLGDLKEGQQNPGY